MPTTQGKLESLQDLLEDFLEEEEEEEEEGEEEEDDGEDSEDSESDSGDSEDGEEKTFTQAEVNRIMSKEKKAGRRSGQRKVLDELGVDSIEEAKQLLTKESDSGDTGSGNSSEDSDKLDKERKRLERERVETKKDRLKVSIERKLIRAGVQEDLLDRAVRMIDLDDLGDGEDDEIVSAIEDLKDDIPTLFEDKRSKDSKPGSHPGGKPRSKGKSSPRDRAMARLQERHPHLNKS